MKQEYTNEEWSLVKNKQYTQSRQIKKEVSF